MRRIISLTITLTFIIVFVIFAVVPLRAHAFLQGKNDRPNPFPWSIYDYQLEISVEHKSDFSEDYAISADFSESLAINIFGTNDLPRGNALAAWVNVYKIKDNEVITLEGRKEVKLSIGSWNREWHILSRSHQWEIDPFNSEQIDKDTYIQLVIAHEDVAYGSPLIPVCSAVNADEFTFCGDGAPRWITSSVN